MTILAFRVLVLCTSFITMPMGHCQVEVVKENNDHWLQKLNTTEEKVTRLHFYLHNIPTAPSPTSVIVAQSSGANTSQTSFGTLSIIDDLLTKGPKPTSKAIGRAQGVVGFCGVDEVVNCMSVNFVFTTRKFNGSSLAIEGRNLAYNPAREMPVVGGTGAFRLARGFLTTTTLEYNTTTHNGIYEYNVVIRH